MRIKDKLQEREEQYSHRVTKRKRKKERLIEGKRDSQKEIFIGEEKVKVI